MNDDIFSGIEPIDSSVVKFGAWLLQESKTFNSFMLNPTIDSVFGASKHKQVIKYRVKVKEHNVCVNRGGELLSLRKDDDYPVGVPLSVGDYVLTEKEAEFLMRRNMCEAA